MAETAVARCTIGAHVGGVPIPMRAAVDAGAKARQLVVCTVLVDGRQANPVAVLARVYVGVQATALAQDLVPNA